MYGVKASKTASYETGADDIKDDDLPAILQLHFREVDLPQNPRAIYREPDDVKLYKVKQWWARQMRTAKKMPDDSDFGISVLQNKLSDMKKKIEEKSLSLERAATLATLRKNDLDGMYYNPAFSWDAGRSKRKSRRRKSRRRKSRRRKSRRRKSRRRKSLRTKTGKHKKI